ncbi:hypothetical protein P885DRAFT_65721 [Corynascus similis CBS 632.67]
MTDSPQPATPPVLAPNLEAQLTCSICTELLYQPLTLLDCLHTFCGACLKEWFRFQADRVESAPGPPPPPGVPLFTCPSCREGVRDTRHDARVFSLLDMFLALNPGRARGEADRREADARYSRGDRVLPRVKRVEERSEEDRRADEEERRVIDEVRALSLREATERAAAAAAAGGGSANASAGSSGARRGRRSREASRVRGSATEGEGNPGRRTTQGATLRVDNGGRGGGDGGGEREGETGRRRRSESRQRLQQVEHQSSLRNLISADAMDVRDIEREVEEFARQIQEEGLLDGLDLDNLDLENNDELSRKITEAYRRRHRERRRDGGRRSNASAHSYRSDTAARPRSRTDDDSRPTSRHAPRSRAPSAGSNDERGRYPPSSSAHLDVQEISRRRRGSSGGRSATLPIVPTQASDVRVGSRAQTDLTSRARTAAGDSHTRRPSMGIEVRSSSSPTSATAQGSRGDSPASRGLPFSARAAAGLSAQPEARSTSTGSRQRSDRPVTPDIRPESPTLGLIHVPISPTVTSPPGASRRPPLPRYKEPFINCITCHKEHIEYEVHYNCSVCHHGDWNICLDCWRRRKGCLHWFGFGSAAWARWEKHNLTNLPTAPPHVLLASRYLPPKQIPGGADGRRVFTTENPRDRLQTGAFCSRCSAWSNDCYWRCDVCNDGEWGFCTSCVNQGNSCTHPLLPLSYHPPLRPSSSSTPSTPSSPSAFSPPAGSSAPHNSNNSKTTHHSAAATVSTTTPTGTFHPLPAPPFPHCSACHLPIPQADAHFHCHTCPSSRDEREGSYDICSPCYAAFVADGSVAPENGPAGWRRCPRGHRMAVVRFVPNEKEQQQQQGQALWRRVVERDLVGGRRVKFVSEDDEEEWGADLAGLIAAVPGGLRVAVWRDPGGRKVGRLFSVDVSVSTAAAAAGLGEGRIVKVFPPDGGTGHRAVAGWGWTPGAGVEDELLFPRGAELLEVEDVNGEWFHGFYMGAQGLFPAPYVRLVGR